MPLAFQVALVVPGYSMLPGMQADLVVSDAFRLLTVMASHRSLGMQVELVVLDSCRSLS